jgi:hypothetical protein
VAACVCLPCLRVSTLPHSRGVSYPTPDLSPASSASHGVFRGCVRSSCALPLLPPVYITALAPAICILCTPIFSPHSFGALQPLSLLICSAARPVLTSAAHQASSFTNPHNTFTKATGRPRAGRNQSAALIPPRFRLLRRARRVSHPAALRHNTPRQLD